MITAEVRIECIFLIFIKMYTHFNCVLMVMQIEADLSLLLQESNLGQYST